jgi:hypothetical protein
MMASGPQFGVDARRIMALHAVFEDLPDLANRHLKTGCPLRAVSSSAPPCIEVVTEFRTSC